MPDDDGWWRAVVEVPTDAAEVVADALWPHGPAAIEEQAAPAGVRLLAGFPSRAAADAAAATARALGARAHLEPVVDDGLDGWRPHARPVRVDRFLVVPAWAGSDRADGPDHTDGLDQTHELGGADDVVLRIDPSHAFGSGSHPTTRRSLAAVGRLVRPGHRVLDVGCGSGILAVAAARLGAAEVVGVDIDDDAPPTTLANAEANGVADRVRATTDPLADVVAAEVATGARFDVVLANLLAPTIRELAGPLVAALAPAGRLVASGLLRDRWSEATDALAGLRVLEVDEEDDWVAVVLGR